MYNILLCKVFRNLFNTKEHTLGAKLNPQNMAASAATKDTLRSLN